MKNNYLFLKFSFFILFSGLLLPFLLNAQINKTLHVSEAGSLHTFFTEEEKTQIDSLTITGKLDARDFRFMRDELIELRILDVRKITIEAYEGLYGTFFEEYYYYPANTFPAYAFYRPYIIRKLKYDLLTFIPDGGILGGECYDTPITVEGFDNATIQSSDNILAIGVKMEHSYLGDLTFRLQCPDGKSVFLKKEIWGSLGGWGGSIFSDYIILGVPHGGRNYSFFDGYPEDEINDPEKNPAGIPFPYYWGAGRTKQQGIMKKGMDSTHSLRIPLVAANGWDTIYNKVLDTSDYINRAGFFTPSESFDSLIGCPINGEWNLIICDEVPGDNGWISEWSIDLIYKVPPKENETKNIATGEDNSSLAIIHLPKDINAIGDKAFFKCAGLSSVYLPDSPPLLGEDVFYGTDSENINLFIPKEHEDLYETAETWKEFNIIPVELLSINSFNTANFPVYPNPTTGIITIGNNIQVPFEVNIYNTLGKRIYTAKNQSIIDISSFSDGIYFIKINNSVSKIVKTSR